MECVHAPLGIAMAPVAKGLRLPTCLHGLDDSGRGVYDWERMAELVSGFDRLPRSGDTMYGFAVGVYPTDQPTLPSTASSSAEPQP